MKACHICSSGQLMQPIDILGNQGEIRIPPAPGSQDLMATVGMALQQPSASLIIKTPDKLGISCEGLRGGNILGRNSFPQPLCIAEGGNAAGGGNTRAGQNRYPWFFLEEKGDFADKRIRRLCHG